MAAKNRFVYILRSVSNPGRHYVGSASNIEARLGFHNAGLSPHTRKYRPWRIVVALEFPSEEQAVRLEKYLKSGSGRAFAKRHFG
jgi:putative endonuclease